MPLNTDYLYNIDKKTASITFHDDGNELSSYRFNNNVITVSALDELTISNPTWGTNKDIKEWQNFLSSCSGRLGLEVGKIRPGYEYEIKVDGDGVTGKLEINGETVADWTWEPGELTIAERDEHEINFAEFVSFVQWMQHFQYAVQNFGG